jgi:AcrR family transcriptional regulator
MNGRAVGSTAEDTSDAPIEGLRQRKKRLMRHELSDTATAMFLERGFDAVRVAEIAQACGVSEKTVFNYFPVKEALIMDRLESTVTALHAGLADSMLTPVQAALMILDSELSVMTGQLASHEDPIRATPALRAYQADMMEQSAAAAAEVLAARAGMMPDDPEPQVAARALLGLWRVQADSLRKHLDVAPTPARLHDLVTADVRRAARLLDTGLRTFTAPASPLSEQPIARP